jgi:hypothetical protein
MTENKTDQGAKNGFEAAQTWQSELGQQFLKEYRQAGDPL